MRVTPSLRFLGLGLLSCSLLACPGDDAPMGTGNASTGSDTTADPPADSTGNGTTNGQLDTTGDDSPPETSTTDGGLDSTGTDGGSESSGGPPEGCDAGMSFATLTSTDNDMITNLDVAGIVSCNQDITLTVTGGTVCLIDDGAGGYFVTVETLALEDVPPVSCGLAEVGLSNISIANTGDYMEVTADQAGGPMTGNQSIQVLGDVEGTALGMAIGPTPLMDFNGVLPEGDAAFGGETTLTYADDSTVIATAMPEVAGFMLTVTLTGLDGSLTFAP